MLLGLRYQHHQLSLGVQEARGLAEAAAQWLLNGCTPAELRHALAAGLPDGGVRCAVGFLRHRLVEKLPPPAIPRPASAPGLQPLVTCAGPGPAHAFRPLDTETHCGPCRTTRTATVTGNSSGPASVLAHGGGWRAALAAATGQAACSGAHQPR
ncbi:hypothetical protein [Streptomyces sp. MZ04]|uniref:hypothetical protein n=1 Tax=Streptomyces sp. MZ04 TaxID=2559236 RepID=UPI00107EA258|nr:hypothetical protein [Streptomyces sp. MZ04]TGB08326.1 hypothetical protein E2651_19525 [Streptomyces sp. MZ04]